MRALILTLWLVFATVCALSSPLVVAAEASSKVTLEMGFGGNITAVPTPKSPALSPACPSNSAPCIVASTSGLDVAFNVPATEPVFDYPPKIGCVTLGLPGKDTTKLIIAIDGDRLVECDLNASFLYTLSIERHGAGATQYATPNPNARNLPVTIEIRWSTLQLQTRKSNLEIKLVRDGCEVWVSSLDVTIEDRSGSLALGYAPLTSFATPYPSTKKPLPRLHDVGADMIYTDNRHSMLAMSFAQNDASISAQRAFSQVTGGAPIPLPSASIGPAELETLMSRTQPLVALLKPSTALGDQDLRLVADSSPFSLTKVGSLASGYTAGYSSQVVSGAGFYGLQRSGLFNEAYALTITIPTPGPSPQSSPEPSPRPCQSSQKGLVPQPSPAPGPTEESNTSHDPLATISILDAIGRNGNYIDGVSGFAFGTNLYKNTNSSNTEYRAKTFHIFGGIQRDAHPLISSPITLTPPYATMMRFVGESGTYTRTLTGESPALPPSFVQFAETVGAQAADRFYSPPSGTVTPFAPLSGSLGHVVISYGTGLHEHVYSSDLLAMRFTTPYGDVFTNEAWQLLIPFDTASIRGWTFDVGGQSQSISDRVAELQQGLVSSYFATTFPTKASLTVPVAPALVRPQSQMNETVQTPYFKIFNNTLEVQATIGDQAGLVTDCAPAPKIIACATAHNHASTWAVFAKQEPIGFGLTNAASASIPGDLALASTSRYFGSYENAPGSVTSYINYSNCLQVSAAYTNAAYPTGIPLPQRGTTAFAKFYYPLRNFGLEGGYFNTKDFQSPTLNASGFYLLARFVTNFKRAVAQPACQK